jgi:hypothetical protein
VITYYLLIPTYYVSCLRLRDWNKFRELLAGYRLLERCPKDSSNTMADYVVEKVMEAYNATPRLPQI